MFEETLQQWMGDLALWTPLAMAVMSLLGWRGLLGPESLQGVPARRAGLEWLDVPRGAAIWLGGMVVVGMLATGLGWNGEGGPREPWQSALMNVMAQGLGQVPVVAWLVWRTRQVPDGLREFGFVPRRPVRETLLGLAGLGVALPVVNALMVLSIVGGAWAGDPPPITGHKLLPQMAGATSLVTLGLLVFSAVVLAPLLEEALFRGLVQTVLLEASGARGRRWLVVVTAASPFALVHGSSVPWQALPGLFVLGVVLGWLYERTGSLLSCVVAHAGFNALNVAAALYWAK